MKNYLPMNIETETEEESDRKFVPIVLSEKDQAAIRERAAEEREEAQARMDATRDAGEDADTLADEMQRINDWLLANEGRHLRDPKERKEYRLTMETVGPEMDTKKVRRNELTAKLGGELPGTYLERPITGGLEDN